MKTKLILFTFFAMISGNNLKLQAQTTPAGKKILIAYFSWSNNGNTRNMAQQIQAATEADVFEIIPDKAYPENYQATVDQAKAEIGRNHKPAIKGTVENFDSYDIIFVGSPNWWSTIAPPVATFLTSYDLKGKTILPFITHEGSRMGRSEADIKKLCADATVLNGLPIRGGSVRNAGSEINKWLRDNKIIE
ncbi:flavodoxin [uncultured Alistipes sp.]|jgi:flavodoxins|uniref:flavodoxin n=1 Tax=uncultured Alistipes sp. TaxID=538949 RepID=UPI0025DD496B|nr:flavodoxin [uncultured Alistipes sp.]